MVGIAHPTVTAIEVIEMKPVWIIDDDRSIRWVFEKALAREGIIHSAFASAREALDALGGTAQRDGCA